MSTAERAQHAGFQRRWLSSWLRLPVLTGMAVFLVNNFLLARLLTSLPGGTVLAPTTMAGVAFVALRLKRPWAITVLYATYGVFAILGHLGVDATAELFVVARILAGALAFDIVISLARFRAGVLPLAMLPCAAILFFNAGLSRSDWAMALTLATLGLLTGTLLHVYLRRRELARQAAGPDPAE